MTFEQLFVLLCIYRGSFNGKSRRETDDTDIGYLIGIDLVNEPELNEFHVTSKGNTHVQQLLKVRVP